MWKYANHRPYFMHLTKNPFKNFIDFGMMKLEMHSICNLFTTKVAESQIHIKMTFDQISYY